MTLNTALFQKVERLILIEGQLNFSAFQMDSWEAYGVCGTTRCVAGWAIYEETGQPLFSRDGDHHPSVCELAARLSVPDDFEDIGQALLGLPDDMVTLFYSGHDTAAEFVQRAARGDSVDSIREWLGWA